MYTPVKSHSSNKMLFSFCLFTPAKFTSNYMHYYKLSQTTRASFSSKPTNLLYTLYKMQKPVVTILYTSCYIQLQTNVGDKILYTQVTRAQPNQMK